MLSLTRFLTVAFLPLKLREIVSRDCETILRTRETVSRSREFISRSGENFSRSREIVSRGDEFISRSREIILRSRETISRAEIGIFGFARNPTVRKGGNLKLNIPLLLQFVPK